jgi:hypothetical protein
LEGVKKRGQTKNAFVPVDGLFTSRARRCVPFEFVLDALMPLEPRTHPMFGCLAVYVGEKIVLMLRNKATEMQDNGVWIATTVEHHASLRQEFPQMRPIQLFGGKISGWQVLPVDAPDFEMAALRASELVLKQDPRIGKVPNARRAATAAKAGQHATSTQNVKSAQNARSVRSDRKKP